MIRALGITRPLLFRVLLLVMVVLAISVSFWKGDFRILMLAAVALAGALGGIWAFTNLHILTCIMIMTVPLSVKWPLGGTVISLPAELMAVALAGILLYRGLGFKCLDKRILFHPLTILLFLELLWMLATTANSTMHVVSLKRTGLRIFYLLAFYLLLVHWFKQPANRPLFFVLLIVGLIPVAINTLHNHAAIQFSFKDAYLVTVPFFDDHTIYGAFIAFVLPFSVIAIFQAHRFQFPLLLMLAFSVISAFLGIAEYLSFSRAAWLSLAGALLLFGWMRLRWSYSLLLVFMLLGAIIIYTQSDRIVEHARNNEAVSNTNDLSQQVRSITNISTDNSNLERINRWETAWHMGKLKPFAGFGPGTYQFQYGYYQMPINKTYLGTYRGDKGNAHSEYLTALSENGWPGAVLFLSWVLGSIYIAMRVIYNTKHKINYWLGVAVLLGLVTFYLHGWVNTFLDQVGMAAVVFGGLAMLTAMDIEVKEKQKNT